MQSRYFGNLNALPTAVRFSVNARAITTSLIGFADGHGLFNLVILFDIDAQTTLKLSSFFFDSLMTTIVVVVGTIFFFANMVENTNRIPVSITSTIKASEDSWESHFSFVQGGLYLIS